MAKIVLEELAKGLKLIKVVAISRYGRYFKRCYESFNFPIGKQRHNWPLIKTRLLKFSSAYRNNLQGCIFLKEINHWLLVFPSQAYFLQKNVFSEYWNRCFRRSRDLFFFAAKSWWLGLYRKFSKFFPWILQFGDSTSVIFLKIKRVKHL